MADLLDTAWSDVLEWSPAERELWLPRQEIDVPGWADTYAEMPKDAPISGKWDNSRNPAIVGPMKAWTDHAYDAITLMMGAQSGKTSVLKHCAAYVMDVDPGAAIWVLPRDEDVDRYPEEFIKPMVEGTERLRRLMSGRKADWKKDRIRIGGATFYFASAGNPSELASLPRRYLFGDECDKWPMWAGKEADPLSLARERMKWFFLSKEIVASTPTVRTGLIFRRWLRSNQQRFWVPCHACGRKQILKWERVRWDERITDPDEMLARQAAWYECAHCSAKIEDRHKMAIMRAGQWVKLDGEIDENGNLREPESMHRNAGFHLWSGYNPVVTWARVVAKFLETQLDPDTLMNFVNSWLAEIWEEQVEAPTRKSLSQCFSNHVRDAVPGEVRWVTMGADVGGKGARNHYVVRGWGADMRSWLIRAGIAQSFDELRNLLLGKWGGKPMLLACVDAREEEGEVLALARSCAERGRDLVRPVKGVEFKSDEWWRPKRIDRHPVTGAPLKHSQIEWHLNVGKVKDALAKCIRTGVGTKPNAFHIHAGVVETYLSHMTAEHKVRQRSRQNRNQFVESWVKRGQRDNHWWDAEVYAYAAAKLAGLEQWTSDRVKALKDVKDKQDAARAQPRADAGEINWED